MTDCDALLIRARYTSATALDALDHAKTFILTSLNRIAPWIFVAGYLAINGRLQVYFFVGRDIFAKYVGKSLQNDAAGNNAD